MRKMRRLSFVSLAGQSLLEVVIAIGVGAVLLSIATASVNVVLRSSDTARSYSSALPLAQELLDNAAAFAEASWYNIYGLVPKGSGNPYYLMASGSSYSVVAGTESILKDGTSFFRSFVVEDVLRDVANNIVTSGGINDPSTQKITVKVDWSSTQATSSLKIVRYLTRWKSFVAGQTDWSQGSGELGPLSVDRSSNKFDNASSNVDFLSVPGSLKLNLGL